MTRSSPPNAAVTSYATCFGEKVRHYSTPMRLEERWNTMCAMYRGARGWRIPSARRMPPVIYIVPERSETPVFFTEAFIDVVLIFCLTGLERGEGTHLECCGA